MVQTADPPPKVITAEEEVGCLANGGKTTTAAVSGETMVTHTNTPIHTHKHTLPKH